MVLCLPDSWSNWNLEMLVYIQWNLDLTKCQGTEEIGLLYRGFVISHTSILQISRKLPNVPYIKV